MKRTGSRSLFKNQHHNVHFSSTTKSQLYVIIAVLFLFCFGCVFFLCFVGGGGGFTYKSTTKSHVDIFLTHKNTSNIAWVSKFKLLNKCLHTTLWKMLLSVFHTFLSLAVHFYYFFYYKVFVFVRVWQCFHSSVQNVPSWLRYDLRCSLGSNKNTNGSTTRLSPQQQRCFNI